MAKFNIPASPKIYSLNIESFKGVDFTNNATQVSKSRSPDAVNMISNLDGFPVKRSGFSLIHNYINRINGIYRLFDGTEHILIHSGTKLYEGIGDSPVELRSDLPDSRSTAFQMNSKLWILTGTYFLVYGKFESENDDETTETYECKKVTDIAYVPTTSIAREATGGGTQFENVNLLSPKRKNTFLSKAGNTEFQLDATDIDSVETVKVLDSSGEWVTKTETSDYTLDIEKGIVKFVTAPGESPVLGRDNIEVLFSKEVSDYADRINKCTTFGIYGVGGTDNRVFLTGNKDMQNFDWFSAVDDPTYIGDLNYSRIGQYSAIMGYRKIGEYMSIHKEDNEQDPTVYLRSGYLDNDNNPVFSIRQGVVGVGAVSKYSFANLRDDPLFLSKQGVNAIVTNAISGTRFAQDRSYYINSKLTKEENLDDAFAIEYKGFYYLAVNGHAYVADSRQKTYEKNANSDSYQYEWYYLDNLDARVFFNLNDELYFGRNDGKLCKFDDSATDLNEPTKAYWTTPLFTFDSLTHYKTLRQFVVMINPYLNSSVQIYYRIKSVDKLVKEQQNDIFDFNNIDFTRFTFNTDDSPRIVVTNRKAKKFMTIQFILRNDNAESFGFLQLAMEYIVLNSKYKGGN